MNIQRITPLTIFSSDARLQLLQLQARRQMAERLAKGVGTASPPADDADADDGDDAESSEAEAALAPLPDRWQLVPPGIALHAWQEKCLPIWLNEQGGRGTVKVATGGGKTLFALAAMERLRNEREPDLRVVIVVPTIPLMAQWKSELLRGNVPESAIALMGGGAKTGLLTAARILICVLNSAREKLPALVQKAGWPERMLPGIDGWRLNHAGSGGCAPSSPAGTSSADPCRPSSRGAGRSPASAMQRPRGSSASRAIAVDSFVGLAPGHAAPRRSGS